MPRGIPNTKRDDTGMRYTTFHVPLGLNPKHSGGTYLKNEAQTLWARNASRRRETLAEEAVPAPDQRRGSQVVVIHPGSRFLRIGRACDVNPVTVTNVIARKTKSVETATTFVEGIFRSQRRAHQPNSDAQPSNGDEHSVAATRDDPFDAKLAAIKMSLRDRMRFYKLRVTPNAASIASTFNARFKPEEIAEHNDPFRMDWIDDCADEVIIGEKVLRLSNPAASGFSVKWPICGGNFNSRDYSSPQVTLSDIETIIEMTLKDKLQIDRHDYKHYSVILVIPDYYDRAYVREFTNLLLVTMGFKQLCAQQESLAATYGAGISNACVVDIGAKTTSISCVDEGLVISDSRMSLHIGGDDITEFLYVLLERICFPYRDIDLACGYDWGVMEDLKSRLCTLAEGDVALNLYDFVVRRPGRPTEKYGLRAYDEIILAPMCIFEPRVIDFDGKRMGMPFGFQSDVTEEIIDHPTDHVTQAMTISTSHLLPPVASSTLEAGNALNQPQGTSGDLTKQEPSDGAKINGTSGEGMSDVPMDIVDIEDDAKTVAPTPTAPLQPPGLVPATHASIDTSFEASKLPLDVAIFNSARAAGGDEKIRKYLQAVLVVGGTARIPGMAHALESRLQAIATPLVPNMEKVQIIPPPKDVDPRVLTWKGAAVLGKMDGVSELWITAADWDVLGMRGLKERCFYL